MKGATLLIVISLLLAYLAISGKYNCLANFWKCTQGGNCSCSASEYSANVVAGLPPLPALGWFA